MHQINLKEQSSPVKSRRECSSNFHLCPSNLNYDEASGRASSSRQVLHRAIKLNATSNSSPTLASFNGLFILTFIALSFIPVQVDSFMNLYLSRTETYRLLGLMTKLYYIQEGKVNDYALGFQVPVPPNISTLHFSWQNLVASTSINYSFGLSASDSNALALSKINITRVGKVPHDEQVFEIILKCKKNYNAEVDINIYLNLTLDSSPESVTSLILKRKKICFTSIGAGDAVEEASPPLHHHHHHNQTVTSTSPVDPVSPIVHVPHHVPSSTIGVADVYDSPNRNVQPYEPHMPRSPVGGDDSYPDISPSSASESPGQLPPSIDPSSTTKPLDSNNPIYIAVGCAMGFILILSLILYLCYLLIQRCFYEGSSLHPNSVVVSLNYPHHHLPPSAFQTASQHQHYYYTGIPSTAVSTLIRPGKNSTQINPYINGTLYGKEASGSLKAKSIKSNATASSHKQSDYSVVSFIYQDLEQGTYFV